jgi:membrane protein implicated in regulation of membrane protease activity
MIGEIARQLIGLFIDDGFLAASILAAVAVASALVFLDLPLTWLAGLVLTLALPVALAASVALSVRRARPPERGG